MPCPIIEISELTQLIADHLLLDDQQALVSLACTCRALRIQALATLWSEQSSLGILIKCTLSPDILSYSPSLPQPTRAEWGKFRRYASWTRRLDVFGDTAVSEDLLRMISDNSPNGVMCPGLRELSWMGNFELLPFFRLFLSPHLTAVTFRYVLLSNKVTDGVLANITSAISELQTSSLHFLCIDFTISRRVASTVLESAISSAVLRCGPSLITLYVSVPLSEAAVQHIMRLPKLTSWHAMNGLPRVSDFSLSNTFPQLETLILCTEASLEWLPLFEATARHTSSGRDAHAPSDRWPGRKLIVLASWEIAPVDAAFMTPIMRFHGLTELSLRSACSNTGECMFGLTDDDVAEIAIALPNLVDATFGEVCSADSCRTTACSLLFLSTSCKKLKTLEIHFNTRNLRDDLQSMPENLRLRGLCGLPRCRLQQLEVAYAPFQIAEEDHGLVVAGFLRIFQSLGRISGVERGWDGLNSKLCNEE